MHAMDAQAALLRVFDRNPAYTDVYLVVLDFCAQERIESEAIQLCEENRTSTNHIQSAAAIVSTLTRTGGLAQSIFVDGVAYEGTFEELQTDESVPDEAEISVRVQTTPEGAAVADQVREGRSLANLVQQCPHRLESFKMVLAMCAEQGGKSTRDIQSALKENNMLEPNPVNGVDGIHASYFTGMLEKHGLLVWNGTSWAASEQGIATLASL